MNRFSQIRPLALSSNSLPFEARTSRNGANKREMLTAKLTAEPRENQRKWETSVNKTAQAKIAEPLKKPLSKTITNDISHMVS